jgi:putative endonuclease
MTESGGEIGWCVYALRCRDSSLYIGSTNHLTRRLTQHDSGTGSKYVRTRRPFELVRVISCQSAREAHQLEYRLKKLKRRRKIEELSLDDDGRAPTGSAQNPTA